MNQLGTAHDLSISQMSTVPDHHEYVSNGSVQRIEVDIRLIVICIVANVKMV